jgi:hypothetical protein
MRYSTILILNNTRGKGICVSKFQPYPMNCTSIHTLEEPSRMFGLHVPIKGMEVTNSINV